MGVIPNTYFIVHQHAFTVIRKRTTVINVFNFLFLFYILCMIINFEINKLISILFVHLSSTIPENFKVLILIIPEIFEFLELHTYKFGLVYKKDEKYASCARLMTCTPYYAWQVLKVTILNITSHCKIRNTSI